MATIITNYTTYDMAYYYRDTKRLPRLSKEEDPLPRLPGRSYNAVSIGATDRPHQAAAHRGAPGAGNLYCRRPVPALLP